MANRVSVLIVSETDCGMWQIGMRRLAYRFMEMAGECAVELQHGYCTVTQAGQFTSHCLVLKTCKMSRCISLFRITTLVMNWQLVAASDRFGGMRQTKCAVVPVHTMKAYGGWEG